MLNNSIGAPTPKSVQSETTKTPVPVTNFIIPEWVHCELCKRREYNGINNIRLSLAYCHPCGHIICRDCAIQTMNGNTFHVTETQVREQVYKLYANMYKQLFDVFDYQDTKWNQLMLHRTEYLRQMNKIKKGMMELEETKRINKELIKIFQEHEQLIHQDNSRYQQPIRQYQSVNTQMRPSSVASSTSLNFVAPQQQQQQIIHNPSSIIKPQVTGTLPNSQQNVSRPEPDKLMTYEQAMIYAHPSLKDACPLEFSDINLGPPNKNTSILCTSTRFTGNQKSKGKSYNVDVIFHHVDLERSYICGYLGITGLIDEYPKLSTFFDAEIISKRYPFLTRKWEADEDVDRQHWSKFDAFLPYVDTFNNDSFDYDQLLRGKNSDFVFMRWKEHFLVPDHTVRNITGASFAGFYYICLQLSTGKLQGYYYHNSSEWFQSLTLEHVPQKTSSVFQFR
ncbi:unnamed protein product [Adineta steineri]|uniref:Uncharacterized protein n=1 Tax=Adineta steineri TaxID=433720 RepID=A0A819VLN1_9BILA|nr:unnamed protein product [Adineta steineri]